MRAFVGGVIHPRRSPMDKVEIALVSVVIGSVLGALGAYFNNKITYERQRKDEASAEFKEAFLEEYILCFSNEQFSIKDKCIDAFAKHHAAIIRFEPFVERNRLEDFRKIWGKYCSDMQFKNLNSMIPEPGEEGYIREMNEKEQRELVLMFYKGLISYASI
jgi:hypothetical protein